MAADGQRTRRVLKLQLTGDALERMLGGDTELEIDIRQCIAEEFAGRYLKQVANTAGVQALKNELVSAIQSMIYEPRTSSWGKPIVTAQVKATLSELAKEAVAAELNVDNLTRDMRCQVLDLQRQVKLQADNTVKEGQAKIDAILEKMSSAIRTALDSIDDEATRKKVLSALL